MWRVTLLILLCFPHPHVTSEQGTCQDQQCPQAWRTHSLWCDRPLTFERLDGGQQLVVKGQAQA